MGKPWENHGKTMGKPGFDVPQKTNPVITTIGTVTAGSKMTWPCVTMMCQCWRTTMRPLALDTLFFRVERGRARGGAWLNHCMFIPKLAITSNKKPVDYPLVN
jgi:hypothetical protein